MTNRLIVTPKNYTVEATVMFDPVSGDTELRIKNKGVIAVSTLHIAGLLSEHASALIKQILTVQPKDSIEATTKPEGANHG